MERTFFSERQDFIKTRSTLENNRPHTIFFCFSWCDVQHVNMFVLSESSIEGRSQILYLIVIDLLYKRFLCWSNHLPVSRSPLILNLLMKVTCTFSSFTVTINLFHVLTVICCLVAILSVQVSVFSDIVYELNNANRPYSQQWHLDF